MIDVETCEEPEWISYTITKIGKLTRFKKLWKNGRKYGYPVCCIFLFSFEHALKDGKVYTRANRKHLYEPGRGVLIDDQRGTFIPCGIFHHRTHDILPSGDKVIAAKTPPIMKLLSKGFCMKTITIGPTGVISIAVLAGIGAGVVLREGLKKMKTIKIDEK